MGDGRRGLFAISWLVVELVCNGKLGTAVCEKAPWMNLDRYMRPIAMSDPGRHAALFDGLPRDTGVLAKTVQGLLIHQHIAPAYGMTLSRDQQAQAGSSVSWRGAWDVVRPHLALELHCSQWA